MANESRAPVTPSSGNVFADLGFADPETALAKAQLADCVQRGIAQRRLEARDAAKLMGISQRRLSALLAGRLTEFSVNQLITLLLALGYDVEIVIRKAPRRAQRGRLQVVVPPPVRRKLRDDRLPINATAIRTRADHRAALKEIERLMDAKPNTSAGRRLEVLTQVVDAYESRHEPIEPPNRVAALRYRAESRRVPRAKQEPRSKAKRVARKTARHR